MNRASILRLLSSIFLLCLAAACSRREESKIRIGMEMSYPPFEMTDESGRPTGVSVDLAKALGESLHREVELQNIPFDGLIPALKTGKIDLIVSSMTATPERAQSIDFSEPYLKTGLCLLVGKGTNIESAKDLNQAGRNVVVKLGTTGYIFASNELKAANVRVLEKESECVLEVVQGKADAFIYDQMSVFKHWQRNAETTRAILKPFQAESWAIGVRKGRPELLTSVNGFLQEFRTRGGFDELGTKYLKEQKEAFANQGIPFLF